MTKFYKFFVMLVFILGASALTERFISYQKNSLFPLTDEIFVGKAQMQFLPMGAYSFILSRASLAMGRLHLNRWHGHQEINSASTQPVKELKASVRLLDGGELSVIWNKSLNAHEGIKIFSDRELIYFKADSLGNYQKKMILADSIKAQSFLVNLSEAPEGIKLTIDNKSFIIPSHFSEGRWGFRGGPELGESSLEEMTATYDDGEIYHQDFEPKWNFSTYFLTFVEYVSILGLLFLWLRNYNAALLASFYCLLISLFVFSMDYYFYSHIHHINNFEKSVKNDKIATSFQSYEKWRVKIFNSDWDASTVMTRISLNHKVYQKYTNAIWCPDQNPCLNSYPQNSSTGGTRLMMVGTSQTLGEGASDLKHSFFYKVHHKLTQKMKIDALNISIAGFNAAQMLEHFKTHVSIYKPHVALINLGFNGPLKGLSQILDEFISVCKNHQCKIILMNEANSMSKVKYIEKIIFSAKKNQVPLINLYSFIEKEVKQKNGEIWWDKVHFTDRGHDLAATFIFNELIDNHYLEQK